MEIKGSQTEKNLLKAFAGESQARNRYTFFAKAAKKEGYYQVARLFLETAEHERIHAKNFFRELPGGDLEITAKFPSGVIGTTEENLKSSIAGEHEENSFLYPEFAQVARNEGFEDLARLFLSVVVVEKMHEKRFSKLLKRVDEDTVWKRDETVRWVCTKCGFTYEDKEPPGKCPCCKHPKEYFEVFVENY
ncbi:rubrerythrin family protein [bacterium]|nr:rubrerythrin family protein [bacterium]MBU1025914.1 rubrerythrin family protein [bacterium]